MNINDFQIKLDKIHNYEYKILSDYKSLKNNITILHKECGFIYDVLPIYIYILKEKLYVEVVKENKKHQINIFGNLIINYLKIDNFLTGISCGLVFSLYVFTLFINKLILIMLSVINL